jgi:hypothetical protein
LRYLESLLYLALSSSESPAGIPDEGPDAQYVCASARFMISNKSLIREIQVDGFDEMGGNYPVALTLEMIMEIAERILPVSFFR